MNNYTKYGLIFLGGVALGALGAMAISRGRVQGVKPLATDLVAGGIALRDKLMAVAEGVKEDIEDVVAEAQLKNQEKRRPRKLRKQLRLCRNRSLKRLRLDFSQTVSPSFSDA